MSMNGMEADGPAGWPLIAPVRQEMSKDGQFPLVLMRKSSDNVQMSLSFYKWIFVEIGHFWPKQQPWRSAL